MAWRRYFLWELRWVAVEMAGVGLGLYLLLLGQIGFGVFALWGMVLASVLVRSHHYSAIQRHAAQHDAA